MLRLIVTTTDLTHAVYGGGEIIRKSRSFDVDLPDLETALNADPDSYVTASLSYEIH